MGGLPTTGGATLATTYPGYISYTHALMTVGATTLDGSTLAATDPGTDPYNAVSFMRQAVDDNPYTLAEAFDPAELLTQSKDSIEEFEALVATYLTNTPSVDGEKQTVESFVAKAAELFNTYNLNTDDDVSAEVDVFEQNSLDAYSRRRSDFEAAMFDINAIESTTYIMGLALLAGERVRSVDNLRAQLMAQGRRDKNVFLLQLAELMTQLQTRNAGFQQSIAALTDSHARWSYAAQRETLQQNVEYDVGEISWELDSLKEAASIMGAIQGIPMSPKKPSNLATAVSTALSIGPQVGMAIGNATGSPALGIGAGLLSAFFSYGSNING